MAEIGSAFLSILPSAKGFGNKLESDVGRETSGVGKKIGGGFGTALKGGAVAALGGAFVAASFLKSSLGEAREAQKIGAATNAIIKATGGAANLTAAQVGDLSGALSNKIGVDDEIIQSGANILLTFKSVRDELGKGNDVFTRATAAGADLAAAGFGSIESNAKTLGKALNDPLKGITALTRSGVTFTDQQKEQIKTLVASGDTLKAQKIILGEVEKQVGGVAAASATSGEKAAVAFGNLKEQIGTALLPVVDKLATFFTDKIVPAVSNFVSEMQSGVGTGGTFVAFLKGLYNTLKPVAVFLYGTVVPAILNFFNQMRAGEGAGGGFVDFLKGIYNAVKPIGVFIMGTVVPAIKSFVAGMVTGSGAGGQFADGLRGIADFVVGTLIPAISGAVGAVKNFVIAVLPAVLEFVAGLAPLVPKVIAIFQAIGGAIATAFDLIKNVINVALPIILALWDTFGGTITGIVTRVFGGFAQIISGAFTIIKGIFQVFSSLLTGDWSGLWEGVKTILSGAFTAIKGIVSIATNLIISVLSTAWAVIGGGVRTAWSGIKSAITSAVNAVKSVVTSVFNAIKSVVTGVWNAIKSATSSTWNAIKSAIQSAINAAKAVVQSQINLMKSAFDGLRDLVGKVRDIFGNILNAIKDKLDEAVNFVKGIPGKIKSAFGDAGSMLYNIGRDIVQGLINGIKNAAGAVASAVAALVDKIPGPIKKIMGIASPSKVTTELGEFIGQGLANGILNKIEKIKDSIVAVNATLAATADKDTRKKIKGQLDDLVESMKDAQDKILDALKSKRDAIKAVLDGFKNDFASLRDSIASTFTGNLFSVEAVAPALEEIVRPAQFDKWSKETQDNFLQQAELLRKSTSGMSVAGSFIDNLLGKRTELLALKKAFTTLRGYGLSPGFLSQLFASGNGALILDLASGDRGAALQGQSLFNETNSLANSLGSQVAKADIGPDIRRQTVVLERIEKAIKQQAREFAAELNGAVRHGQRSAA